MFLRTDFYDTCIRLHDSNNLFLWAEEISEEIISPEQSQRSTLRDEEAPPRVETEEESETPPVESDSEGVMIAPKPSKRRLKPEAKPVCYFFKFFTKVLSYFRKKIKAFQMLCILLRFKLEQTNNYILVVNSIQTDNLQVNEEFELGLI